MNILGGGARARVRQLIWKAPTVVFVIAEDGHNRDRQRHESAQTIQCLFGALAGIACDDNYVDTGHDRDVLGWSGITVQVGKNLDLQGKLPPYRKIVAARGLDTVSPALSAIPRMKRAGALAPARVDGVPTKRARTAGADRPAPTCCCRHELP